MFAFDQREASQSARRARQPERTRARQPERTRRVRVLRGGKRAECKRQRELRKSFFDSLNLSAVCDDHFCAGFAAAAAQRLHLLDERHALNHLAENNLKAQVN
jgi:hypothetical protein